MAFDAEVQRMARAEVTGDGRRDWFNRWLAETDVPAYISTVIDPGVDHTAPAPGYWCQQALVTYNKAAWVLKKEDGTDQIFANRNAIEVAEQVRPSSMVVQLMAQASRIV